MPVNYIFSLKHLSADFYSAYPISTFPEILQDSNRSYVMVLFQVANGQYVGTPFRTNMRHNNGYHFKNSQRSLKNRSGIDYSKSVIINDIKYIDSTTHAIIDKDEWKEFKANSNKIIREIERYIKGYVDYHSGALFISNEEYQRKYSMTSLKYFQRELGIK